MNSRYFVYVLVFCGYGVNEFLDNGKVMLDMMISCMDKLSFLNVRIEGFKLV